MLLKWNIFLKGLRELFWKVLTCCLIPGAILSRSTIVTMRMTSTVRCLQGATNFIWEHALHRVSHPNSPPDHTDLAFAYLIVVRYTVYITNLESRNWGKRKSFFMLQNYIAPWKPGQIPIYILSGHSQLCTLGAVFSTDHPELSCCVAVRFLGWSVQALALNSLELEV